MDMSYIMDSDQNRVYTTFPNIFSLLSADPADLSYIQKNHFSKKKSWFFDRKSALKGPELVQQQNQYSLKSAETSPTNP